MLVVYVLVLLVCGVSLCRLFLFDGDVRCRCMLIVLCFLWNEMMWNGMILLMKVFGMNLLGMEGDGLSSGSCVVCRFFGRLVLLSVCIGI